MSKIISQLLFSPLKKGVADVRTRIGLSKVELLNISKVLKHIRNTKFHKQICCKIRF